MFGVVPGLVTARLTGLLAGLVVTPLLMLAMMRHDAYRLPVRLSWFKAFVVSAVSFLLLFAPVLLVPTTVLLQYSAAQDELLPMLLWGVLWFLAAFAAASLIVSAVLKLSFAQALTWWGVAFTASMLISWLGALALASIYRYLILPGLTDFF
ncbi:MAG: hypothetical protein ABFD13_05670 [Candidatus Cryosericum sp.]|nr:hypothetical protein [bacterium]